MSSLTTREAVTPEWAEAVASALFAQGWAYRAGYGSTIEVQSDRRGWMPLNLPGGSEHFDSKATRDAAIAAIQDTLHRAHRFAIEQANDGTAPMMAEIRALPVGARWGAYLKTDGGTMTYVPCPAGELAREWGNETHAP